MRLILLILLIIHSSVSFAQKSDTLRKFLDEKLSFTNRSKAIYPALATKIENDWVLYSSYPDTNLLLKMWFKDKQLTIKSGPYTLYYPKKVKAVQGYYHNNQQVGLWRYWYKNGQLKDSGNIQNENPVGTWYSWYENGNFMAIGEYAKADSNLIPSTIPKSVEVTSLIPSTELVGTRNGRWIFYHENGIQMDSGAYKDNWRTGLWKTWYQNGQMEAMGSFEEGLMEGEWVWYRENGKQCTKEFYKKNKLVSIECFDEEGNFSGDYCSILKPPYPIGDFNDFQAYMLDNIILPKELTGKELKGVVKISCLVGKEGKLKTIKAESPYAALNKEVERFFNTLSNWSPAITHNRLIDYTMEYEIKL